MTPTVLDWRNGHTGRVDKCRHCGGWTNLRDDQGKPSHKVCAERARGAA